MNTAPPATAAADILERAAEVLETDGWTQGTSHDPDTGGWCAHGAISRAAYADGGTLRSQATLDARMAASAALPANISLVGFNDDPSTTQFDVIDHFKHTAKALRNGELDVPAWLRGERPFTP